MAKTKQVAKGKTAQTKAEVAKTKKVSAAKVKGPQPSVEVKKASKAQPAKAGKEKEKELGAQKTALASVKTEKSKGKVAPAAKLSVKMVAEAREAKVAPVKPAKKTRLTKAQEEGMEKATQLGQKWSSLYRKTQEQQAKPYNMRHTFEAKTPIMHKVLGWGYILSNKNDRLEVLFKDGIRYLISNYKA